MRELKVYINTDLVGLLSEDNDIWSFQYAQEWLDNSDCYALCLDIPLSNGLQVDGSSKRYIQQIMNHLLGSKNAEKARIDFMKAQVLFWLMGASDGHAKNFSIFILPDGQFQLTPLYDVLSVFPVVNKKA